MFVQVPMHVKAIPQQMRLMSPALPQALEFRLVEVILQNRLIVRMRALVNDHPRTLSGRQAAHIRKSLLGDDDVEIVLRLVDVRAHGHDAGHAVRVCLAGPRGGRVHDAVFC